MASDDSVTVVFTNQTINSVNVNFCGFLSDPTSGALIASGTISGGKTKNFTLSGWNSYQAVIPSGQEFTSNMPADTSNIIVSFVVAE